MRKGWFKALIAGMTVAVMAGPVFAGDTIKLGVPGAHSGDLASYGLPSANAAKIVAKMFNDKGGINGKMVEVIPQDDQCKPEMATNAATKLVSDGVDIVLGHICSGATKAALPIYKEANKVVMSPSATTPALTQSGDYPMFFRTISSDDQQAKLGVDFAIDKLGAKKIAVLHDKGDYGKGYAEYAKQFIEQSGKATVVLFEGVTPGAVDYSAVVQKVRSEGADAVMFGGYHPEASKIVAQMRKKRMTTPFISDDGVKDDTFIKVAGKDAEGVYASSSKDVSMLPMYKEAIELHKKEFGTEPGAFYKEAFAAAQALLTAVQRAGSTETPKVVDALRNNFVETAIGKIKFDKRGDAEGTGFSMYQVKNGVYVELK
ncbi:branched-chain amino acid ABC transporter substrate-binding protein [Nitratidesulfovibrio vulgaris]|uniref:High-affinity branched chain amino acid ABC transporter, periplasmic branched chain amino acid-binding protein n=2 Tax=Nitratidesulfovibrio vulgaris TaxID=881 RepID=Q72EN0_NITV2|nr:branched-chain amino acid ABC transporter substrate-binding protein [Nitratidesulfovibrio vulgaris]GEB80729.1 branched chain amino acid ABC transporter substrate-binding protein [Desulfovibrio desulfuricans]HBW17073.1 branched-chain amino acid ABC transporter substrate-binding protein [Desulfovibrio sp.]AAS95029.1 high-affinity branched chain amino acid ABC transporter, periplasmic branched chain amino acid-binding protein [Nitratidesulfovibrio vulgaris str. Hildenborough]ABM29413.1 L-leucin